ncbi:MAG: glutamyl-tRNA reductase [Pseudomonadales bacterium]|nr:glutamyl-tRNA reductase [Pseudomonadales bacterium]NRA15290.1 glutamyl-tRNA reductase [Oceanospirillaceae bacterium]
MTLLVLGINHKTASVDVRERLAIAPAAMEGALMAARQVAGVSEVAILSTCNRTEIYCSGSDCATSEVLQWLSEFQEIAPAEIESSLYSHTDDAAAAHMMRVACGLDSLVLGEPQILGQLKSSFAVSQNLQLMKGELGNLFQQAFSVAKKVRTDTAIGENPVSVAYAAVNLAQHIFSDLADSRALLIGAGETIELVARHLVNAGVKEICVANRTLDRAQALAAKFSGEAIMLGDIPQMLHSVDIVIASTASQLPILGKGAVESALLKRKHQPMFMIDIAVPRDIEVQVKELDDVYLYSVDDLQQVIQENQQQRRVAALEAEKIIIAGVEKYVSQQRSREVVDTLTELRSQTEMLRDSEVAAALKLLAKGVDAEHVITELGRRLTNKVLHYPSIQLRKASAEGRSDITELTAELFQLGSVNKDK